MGRLWASASERPRVSREVSLRWDELIDTWATPVAQLAIEILVRLRHEPGVTPVSFLNARQNAASDSYPFHFRYSTDAGLVLGDQVARHALGHALRPRPR
jgi:hypothetical protein